MAWWQATNYLHWLYFSCVFSLRSNFYLSPLALAWSKLQSKAAENNFCVWSLWCSLFFGLAHYSTCNLKIYLYTVSAADMVFLLVFSLKTITGLFCYLPDFFYFDNIFLALHNPCENCKYCKSIPSCFLLGCLLTLSRLFHAAISKYLQPMFCHHQTVCFWIQFQN